MSSGFSIYNTLGNSVNQLQSRAQQAGLALKQNAEKYLTAAIPPEEILYFEGIQKQIGACGVGDMYNFRLYTQHGLGGEAQAKVYKDKINNLKVHNKGGCGFLSVAFIDTEPCKVMYQTLKRLYPCLYQSPIRMNINSGNNFFFCIFDTGENELPDDLANEIESGYHKPGFVNGLEW